MRQVRYRLTRRIVAISSVILAVVLITWLFTLGLGVTIPLDALRSPVEAAISKAVGRDAHIHGALFLKPAIYPAIIAHDVRITNPSGSGDLLRAERVTFQLPPLALLENEPSSAQVLIEDTTVNLDIPQAVSHATAPAESGAAGLATVSGLIHSAAALLQAQPELRELVLNGVVLNFRKGAVEQPYRTKVDEISVHREPGLPLELMLHGRLQQQPYTLNIIGGRLEDLFAGTQPWPLQADIGLGHSRMLLTGSLMVSREELAARFGIRVVRPDTSDSLPASADHAALSGQLSLLAGDDRPVFSGELRLPAIDAVLHLGTAAVPEHAAAARTAGSGEIPHRRLISMPLTAHIADVVFHGRLTAGGMNAESVADLTLSATGARAAGLFEALTGISGIHGRLGHIGFQASIGNGGADLPGSVQLDLQVSGATLSYGHNAGERPVDFTFDNLVLMLPAGEDLMVNAQGTLLDEPFTVELTSASLGALLAEKGWPVTLSATGAGAVLNIDGMLATTRGDTATRLNIDLHGKRIGNMASWAGVTPCASGSYALQGQLLLDGNIRRLRFLRLQTERTRLQGELDWSGDEEPAPLHAMLDSEELHPADIEMLTPLVSHTSGNGGAGGIAIDIPVLPALVEIPNADIDLNIAHILLELIDISEVSLGIRLRNGRMQRSYFHTHIGGFSFQGHLDPTASETTVVFEDEENSSKDLSWMARLNNSAIRWVERKAVIPLRWIFKKSFFGSKSTDCRIQGSGSGS